MKKIKKYYYVMMLVCGFVCSFITPKVLCHANELQKEEEVRTLFGEVILEDTESGPIIAQDDVMMLFEYTGKRDWKWPVPSSDMLSSCYLDGRSHYAIDIAASKGAPIYASYPGVVIGTSMACSHNYGKSGSCGCNGGMGNYVFIRHTYEGIDFVTRSIHLTKVNVSVGTQVTKDTVIGTVGSTGSSRGFHLDFRIYQGSAQTSSKSTCVDPLKDQFLEMPSGLNANAASTSCCYTYVKEVKKIYEVPLLKEEESEDKTEGIFPEPIPQPKPPVNTGKTPFYDVPGGQWYHDAVEYVYNKKIMSGMTEQTFGPDDRLTRAQFAAMLYRLEGSKEVTFEDRFSDVLEGQWYSNAVIWANDTKIVSGYLDSSLFGTDDPITREQIAVMLYRYAAFKEYDLNKTADYTAFTDGSEVSEYAQEAVSWAIGSGFISGKTKEILAPLGDATRAECASVFMRFMNVYHEKE